MVRVFNAEDDDMYSDNISYIVEIYTPGNENNPPVLWSKKAANGDSFIVRNGSLFSINGLSKHSRIITWLELY